MYVADNIDKLPMLFDISSAQGIKGGSCGQDMTSSPHTTSHSSPTEIATAIVGVYQHVTIASTLIVEEETPFPYFSKEGVGMKTKTPLRNTVLINELIFSWTVL